MGAPINKWETPISKWLVLAYGRDQIPVFHIRVVTQDPGYTRRKKTILIKELRQVSLIK
jgi:hypothetical protein